MPTVEDDVTGLGSGGKIGSGVGLGAGTPAGSITFEVGEIGSLSISAIIYHLIAIA
jgi:hypothetical protein